MNQREGRGQRLGRVQTGLAVLLISLSALACGATDTGTPAVTFQALAAGPEAAAGSLSFENQLGYSVELQRAELLVGGMYVNRQVPLPGVGAQPCVLPGTYVAEVTAGAVIDVLDGRPQPFPTPGIGIQDRGFTGELWLKGDDVDIDAPADGSQVLDARGIARRGNDVWPFETRITVSQNRRIPDPDLRRPGANPICRARIVSPISVDLRPSEGGQLLLRIHPEQWFSTVDFGALTPADRISDSPPLYRIPDSLEGQPALNLWNGLKRGSAYAMQFTDP